jgi:hypothetical protein
MARPCPICTQVDHNEQGFGPVEVTEPSPDGRTFVRIKCPRCGVYDIAQELSTFRFDESIGIKLSGVIAEHTDRHVSPPPVVVREELRELAMGAAVPTRPSGYFDIALSHLAELCRYPGRSTGARNIARLAARTFLPYSAYDSVLGQLKAQGLIYLVSTEYQRTEIALTASGWRRVDEAAATAARRSTRAFVAMWFDASTKDVYTTAIRPALVTSGYTPPFRVDDPEHDAAIGAPDHHPKIDNRILAEIRRARFLVVEVTGNRTSVYFEAGFAEGLGIPIVWCCRRGSESDMAFDTRQNAHILWDSLDDLRIQLLDKIRRHGWDIQDPQT